MVRETFFGYVESTKDVLLLFEGCKRGLLPRVGRRLQESERNMIRSGSIFIFDEKEAGIKRWTDGRVWSPSRILGNFLIYRELDKKLPSHGTYEFDHPNLLLDKNREKQLVGCLSDNYTLRKGGLIKKTMSVIVDGVPQHFISYYDPLEVIQGKLRTTSSMPELASLEISPELIFRQNFRVAPLIEATIQQPHHCDPHFYTTNNNDPNSHKQRIQEERSISLNLDRLLNPIHNHDIPRGPYVQHDQNAPYHHRP